MKVAGNKLLFRMPVIPGYNDSEYEKIVEFVQGIPLELLPYHAIGVGKYEALGMEYKLKGIESVSDEKKRITFPFKWRISYFNDFGFACRTKV